MDFTPLLYLIPLFLTGCFIAAYKTDKTNLAAGVFLTGALVSLMSVFFIHAYFTDSRVMRTVAVLPLAFIFILITSGVYFFILFLIFNTRIILRKERRELKHILTLLLAVLLIVMVFAPRYIDFALLPRIIVYAAYSAYGVCVFYLIHLAVYIISMILCNLPCPKYNQDYIIILGCWIKNGAVTPILARRIDKAIDFYNKQSAAGKPPKLIMSGGKGNDETVSEAEAMRVYARARGIPEGDILLEPDSVSTLENMKFSKALMDKDAGGKPYNCIYATNNYHLLRAGIYAKKAGLRIDGIGAETAYYYLPNAVLREYIAYIFLHFKRNAAFVCAAMVLGCVFMSLIDRLLAG